MSTQYIYSPSTIVYIWGNIDVILCKWYLKFLGLGELIFAAAIWVLWAIGVIPSIRPLWFYCGVYYIVFIPIWLMNILMAYSRSNELFLFAWFANIFVFAVTVFVFGLIIYDLVACGYGWIPIDCRNTYWIDIPVAIITAFLVLITLGLVLATTNIISRIRQSSNVKGIYTDSYYGNQPPSSSNTNDNSSSSLSFPLTNMNSRNSGNIGNSGNSGNSGNIHYDPAYRKMTSMPNKKQRQLYSTKATLPTDGNIRKRNT